MAGERTDYHDLAVLPASQAASIRLLCDNGKLIYRPFYVSEVEDRAVWAIDVARSGRWWGLGGGGSYDL